MKDLVDNMASVKPKLSLANRLVNLTKRKPNDSKESDQAKLKGPEIVKKFVYHPLDSSKKEIRLLELRMSDDNADDIQCEIIITTLDKAPSYEALSYTV